MMHMHLHSKTEEVLSLLQNKKRPSRKFCVLSQRIQNVLVAAFYNEARDLWQQRVLVVILNTRQRKKKTNGFQRTFITFEQHNTILIKDEESRSTHRISLRWFSRLNLIVSCV